MNALQVKHTLTFDGDPLAVVENLPGMFAELRPPQLRALAAALLAAAEDCERHAAGIRGRCYAPNKFSNYPLRGLNPTPQRP